MTSTIPMGGGFTRTAPSDTYWITDSNLALGGPWSQATHTDRDAIPAEIRRVGAECYTANDTKTWQLQGGITNSDWVDVTVGSGGGVPTSREINTTAPLTGGGNLTANLTISMSAATASVDGYLVGSDWTIFNNKQAALGYTPANATLTLSTSAPLTGGGNLSANRTISIPAATASVDGYLTGADWTVFNNKQIALGYTPVNQTLTLTTTAPLTGGGNLSTNRTLSIPAATASVDGYLTGADWTTFNSKLSTSRSISTTAPLTGGGDLTANRTLSIPAATASVNGYLVGSDWTVFNNKQAALGYTPVNQTLTISTTAPLTGGGDLSTNRALSMPAATASVNGYLTGADWTVFNNKLSTASHIPDSQVDMGQLGTTTYKTLQDYENTIPSSGKITGFTLTGYAAGANSWKVAVSAGTCAIHATDATGTKWEFADYAGATVTLPSAEGRYFLYAYISGGAISIGSTTDRRSVHKYDQFIIGRVYAEATGDTTETSSTGFWVENNNRRIHEMLIDSFDFWHAPADTAGSRLSEIGTRGLYCTAGIWYIGSTEIDTPIRDTTAGTPYQYDIYYYNGAAWIKGTTSAALGNSQYNNLASGLVGLTGKHYGVYWVTQCVQGDLYVIYGQASYTSLSDAQASKFPTTLPLYVSLNTKPIARIIFRNGDTHFTEVDSAFDLMFVGSTGGGVVATAPITGDGTSDNPLVIASATASVNGYLAGADWTVFNNKVPEAPSDGTAYNRKNAAWVAAVSGTGSGSGTVTVTAPLTGNGLVATPIQIPKATDSVDGYLSKEDHAAFAAVVAAGNGSVQRVLTAALTVASGMSYVLCGPLESNGYTVSIASTGRLRVL
jgi:hypothetical protein